MSRVLIFQRAKLIYNPSSAAPGFKIKNVLSLPGVPSILNSMIENCKQYLVKGSKIYSKTLNLFTVESNISRQLGLIQNKYKKFVDIGSYPFFRLGKIGVAIVTRSNSNAKLKKTSLKEIKFRPSTDVGDYNIKLKKIKSFILDGDKTKITVRFRGREILNSDLGLELLNKLKEELVDIAQVDQEASLEGRQLLMVLSPLKKNN